MNIKRFLFLIFFLALPFDYVYAASACPGGTTQAECLAGCKWITGTSTCDKCPAGEYQDVTGQTTCKPCPAGKYCDGTGSPTPANCAAGYFCPAGSKDSHGDTGSGENKCDSALTGNNYKLSDAGAANVNACYLNLTTTKYVAAAGGGLTGCIAGNFCNGTTDGTNTKVYYGGAGSVGGATNCSTATGGKYPSSAADSDAIADCSKQCSAGNYWNGTAENCWSCSSTQSTITIFGTYCPATTTAYYQTTTNMGTVACTPAPPSGASWTGGGGSTNSCPWSGISCTDGNYWNNTAHACQTCKAGYYCPAVTVVTNLTSADAGLVACPFGKTSPTESNSATACAIAHDTTPTHDGTVGTKFCDAASNCFTLP